MLFETRIIGRVGRDPELKYTQSGKAVCSFSVATSPMKDKTVWVKVTAWEKDAENISKYVRKGSLIYCEGTLQVDENGFPRVYTAADGTVKASNFELTTFKTRFLTKVDTEAVSNPKAQSSIDFNDPGSILDQYDLSDFESVEI